MACKTENKIINEVEYSCTQFPAIDSMVYKLELIKVLGPAFSEIAPIIGSKENDKSIDAIGKAVVKMFESASPQQIVALILKMLTTGHLKRDGKRMTESLFTEVYSGDNLMEAYKAFGFVLRVNYSGFIKGQKAEAILAKVEENL